MNLALVYIYPLGGAQVLNVRLERNNFYELAIRFLQSYHDHPPGVDHQTVIVCNGSPADDETKFLFSSLPNLTFLEHDNSGQDLGGYQFAARQSSADAIMFLGASTYVKREGWLRRFAEVWEQYGDGLFGSTASGGDTRFNIWLHVRTTGFLCSPQTMNNYPMRVTGMGEHQRYAFEHGEHCLTSWCLQNNKRVWVVSWDSVFPVHLCSDIPNGFHRGDQSNVLIGDRLCAPPFYPVP